LAETQEALRKAASVALADDRWRPLADAAAVAGFLVLTTLFLIQPGGGNFVRPAVDTLALSVFYNRVDYPPTANPYGSPHKGDANKDANRDHRVYPLPGVAD
jgi:hypothetical protein